MGLRLLLVLGLAWSLNPSVTSSDNDVSMQLHHRVKRWEFSTYQVTENRKDAHTITTLRSSFDDGKKEIRYYISGPGAGTIFRVHTETGDLVAIRPVDREQQSSYNLNISARNLQGEEVEEPSTIKIEVQDVNDNKPRFPLSHYQASVREMAKTGTVVTNMTALDDDDPNGPYGTIQYSLLPSNTSTGNNLFMIDPWTGEVKTTKQLDREKTDTYQLLVQARDDPGSALYFSCTATLTVSVIDINDNPPIFTESPYQTTIPETTEIGSEILTVRTVDADQLQRNIVTSYSIVPGNDSSWFQIETRNNEGVIRVKKRLDYETAVNKQYRFTVRARNNHPESEPNLEYLSLEDMTDVIVMVTDANEPPEFRKEEYTFYVREDMVADYPLNSIQAIDPEGDMFTYWLDDVTGTFFINRDSGFLSLRKTLDWETTSQYQMHAMAGLPNSYSQVTVNVIVIDVNDNSPTPKNNKSLELILCQNTEEKTLTSFPNIAMVDADSKDQGPPFHYLPVNSPDYNENFRLIDNKNSTATLVTKHNSFFVTDLKQYQVEISVRDSGDPPRNATYKFTVRVCYCPAQRVPVCEATYRAGEPHLSILAAALVLCLLLLIIIFIVIRIRRHKRHGSEVLIKTSLASSESEIRENFVTYTEEGGGEEDTSAFDLNALQRNFYAPTSLHLFDGRSDFICAPENKSVRNRRFVPSQDIRDFINSRKSVEDDDDRILAFDSLQVYAYEGEESEAGSLSSICSSATDSEQNYDYLRDWGPRFRTLAEIYDERRLSDPNLC